MSNWPNPPSHEWFWVSAGLVLLALYYLWMAWRTWLDPLFSTQGVNREARRAWVQHIMADPGLGILAVQTLRNSTMAATFLASTAILLIIGVLNLSGKADQISTSWQALSLFGQVDPKLWDIKLLALLIDFFVAFFSFAMAVRLFNHVGYQITLPPALRPAVVSPEQVARHLNRAGGFYSIGMRAYYLCVPLVFWLFGPHFMMLACLALIPILYAADRAQTNGR
ncbi:DUF599 domain-containing protein [Allochromatium vinosum]|uniref:DUF599 domain-containing protein n=1 Tax=Allochromatium vinosum (strain ATCC 17899 / DSM 180 / NBRC 103801 / NCIMB 10441 / D) TaxID=572477 RepID=D3RT69_ALLVD|nr:DUF599 domain-containing protein [Allochromatium vinosum]ADC62378.1 protein of unknown function DUF599 [Allochromatium vinosum DSM 180]